MWYSSGTVSATNDSNVITGTGTAFIENVRIGDGITIQGSQSLHEVIGIASNTQLTIRPAYNGPSGSGKQYAIAPVLGYDKDLSDAFNQLRLQFGGTLSGIKPWATAPTGETAMDELGFGLTGKDVARASTPSAAMDELGFGAAGKALAGAVTPADGRTALELGDAALADVVGDMSAGAIIERGSNANGEYVRFADGTQICSLYSPSVSVSSTARTEGGISFFYAQYMWSFPANFASPPFTELTARIERANGVLLFAPITVSTVTGVSSDFRISGPQEIVSLLYMSAIAIGRWK